MISKPETSQVSHISPPINGALTTRVRARLSRCAHNTAPCLLIFLICALLMFLFFLHIPGMVHAASINTGQITGQVLDGSQNNAPVAHQSVVLQLAQGNSSRDFITLTTDAQGRYAFSALESDSTVQYAVYTLYQGAQYVTDLIDLSKNANQQVNLTVYDATTSTANLAVVQSAILLEKPNPQTGMLSVSEDFFFENLSTQTYVGSLDANKGKPNALLFALPANARFLSLGTGFDGYHAIQVNTGFATDAAVLPGTSRFSFSFQVPYSTSHYHFSYTPVYPTLTLSVLTPLDILVNAPQGLSAQGTTNTPSGTYQMLKAQTLRPSQTVQVDLGGLPIPIKAAAAPTQAPVNATTLWLIVLLILVLASAGVGGSFYRMRRQRAKRAPQKTLARKSKASLASPKSTTATSKEALLRELLALDKAYEAGKLKKASYQEQRARLNARLRNVISEQQEREMETAGKSARTSSKEAK